MAKKGGNPQNLIPLSERSAEERKRVQSMGGKATAEAVRRRKSMKEQLEIILKMPVVNKEGKSALVATGITDPDLADNQAAILAVTLAKALGGNLDSIGFIRDTIGEKPSDTLNLGDGGVKFVFERQPENATADDLSG